MFYTDWNCIYRLQIVSIYTAWFLGLLPRPSVPKLSPNFGYATGQMEKKLNTTYFLTVTHFTV